MRFPRLQEESVTVVEFLERDVTSHPPLHAPDTNIVDRQHLRLVEQTEMDHLASFVRISERWHEREVQPIDG